MIVDKIINYQIKGFGPINNLDIDIGKINIVGGHNATGKSTASKLLYCFLKANSNKRQDFAYGALVRSITSILLRLGMHRREINNLDLIELLDAYEELKEKYLLSDNDNKFINKDIDDIDYSIDEIEKNGVDLYLSILKNLLQIEFLTKSFDGNVAIKDNSDNDFEFSADFTGHDDDFTSRGSLDIYDVFYIDSFSIFDLDRLPSSFKIRYQNYYDHVDYLRLILKDSEDESKDLFDLKKNKKIISVEKKVEEIIGGKIEYENSKFVFTPKNSKQFDMHNTASGIKQIGVIQLLLSNRKLKEDSFLIIDEPEVNLHPEWQFKLAEILILLAKELNISVYINTHSPMFIEAIEVFSQYHDLTDECYYYLTEKDRNSDAYNFKYIPFDDLYELYDNLAKPYLFMEDYRIKIKHSK